MSAAHLAPLDRRARRMEAKLRELEPLALAVAKRLYIPGFDPEDVAQVARIGIWEALQAWDGSTALSAFAYMVARRRVIDQIEAAKRERRRANAETVATRRGLDGEEEPLLDTLADPRTTEELAELRGEIAQLLRRARLLTPLERRALSFALSGIPYTGEAVGGSKSLDNAAQRARLKLAGVVRKRTAA